MGLGQVPPCKAFASHSTALLANSKLHKARGKARQQAVSLNARRSCVGQGTELLAWQGERADQLLRCSVQVGWPRMRKQRRTAVSCGLVPMHQPAKDGCGTGQPAGPRSPIPAQVGAERKPGVLGVENCVFKDPQPKTVVVLRLNSWLGRAYSPSCRSPALQQTERQLSTGFFGLDCCCWHALQDHRECTTADSWCGTPWVRQQCLAQARNYQPWQQRLGSRRACLRWSLSGQQC